MNHKENFVEFLRNSTFNGDIVWAITKAQSPISQYITNPDFISQIFHANVKENDIYFVIHKYIKYVPELDQYYEQFEKFLLVLDGNYLVYSVFESEVSEDMLNILAEEIRGKQESAFFDSFMQN